MKIKKYINKYYNYADIQMPDDIGIVDYFDRHFYLGNNYDGRRLNIDNNHNLLFDNIPISDFDVSVIDTIFTHRRFKYKHLRVRDGDLELGTFTFKLKDLYRQLLIHTRRLSRNNINKMPDNFIKIKSYNDLKSMTDKYEINDNGELISKNRDDFNWRSGKINDLCGKFINIESLNDGVICLEHNRHLNIYDIDYITNASKSTVSRSIYSALDKHIIGDSFMDKVSNILKLIEWSLSVTPKLPDINMILIDEERGRDSLTTMYAESQMTAAVSYDVLVDDGGTF